MCWLQAIQVTWSFTISGEKFAKTALFGLLFSHSGLADGATRRTLPIRYYGHDESGGFRPGRQIPGLLAVFTPSAPRLLPAVRSWERKGAGNLIAT